VIVTDGQGHPLPGVAVSATGPLERRAETGDSGSVELLGLRAGTYRLRFDAEGWVSFEREIALAVRPVPGPVDVTLTAAPPPPPPPPPPPVEKPAATENRPVGEFRVTDVASFADRNLIRSGEPQKQNVFGCTGYATTRLVQIRDPMEKRVLENADETLYVLAGEGVLTLNGRQEPVTAGVLAVIPRGSVNSLTRKGRGPLVLVSVVSGPPCSGEDR
jgi:mannose-6-phosphate isomerase-like protein (cupin superfamily)